MPRRKQEHNAMSEHVPGPSRSGSVVLNVGPGIGALVLHVPADLDRREIEISSPATPAALRTHSQVRERRTAGSVQYAAVYPGLAAGDYLIWRDASTVLGVVTIEGVTSPATTGPTPCPAPRRVTTGAPGGRKRRRLSPGADHAQDERHTARRDGAGEAACVRP
jgi:hypothetical protein